MGIKINEKIKIRCPKCGEERTIVYKSKDRLTKPCKSCAVKKYYSEHPRASQEKIISNRRKRRKKYYENNKEKELIRGYTLKNYPEKRPCTKCGDGDAERHHNTYTVDDFVWLCKQCHLDNHNGSFSNN